jgi:hypothetical protein
VVIDFNDTIPTKTNYIPEKAASINACNKLYVNSMHALFLLFFLCFQESFISLFFFFNFFFFLYFNFSSIVYPEFVDWPFSPVDDFNENNNYYYNNLVQNKNKANQDPIDFYPWVKIAETYENMSSYIYIFEMLNGIGCLYRFFFFFDNFFHILCFSLYPYFVVIFASAFLCVLLLLGLGYIIYYFFFKCYYFFFMTFSFFTFH